MCGERGSVTVPYVILLPAVFLMLLVAMQAALFYHARTVAIAAAQEGARAAGAEEGHAYDGNQAASGFIATVGEDVLLDATTTTERGTTTVSVTVQGFSQSVIPGWHPKITHTARMPVERVSSP